MAPPSAQSLPLLIKTKLCAPPGYGKTTLLTEWIAALQKTEAGDRPTACWLSLDAQDIEERTRPLEWE